MSRLQSIEVLPAVPRHSSILYSQPIQLTYLRVTNMAKVQSQAQSVESQYLIPKIDNPFPLNSRNHTSSEQNKSASSWNPPLSGWTSLCHPCVDEVSHEVDDYFLRHWNFPTAESRKVFVKAGFSRVTCLYFPLAKDDRIHLACRLLTLLFLIDDVLEDMSLAEGEAYNAKLIPISRGDVLPNRKNFHLQREAFGHHSLKFRYR